MLLMTYYLKVSWWSFRAAVGNLRPRAKCGLR